MFLNLFFYIFPKFFFENRKLCLKLFLNFFKIFKYLFIYLLESEISHSKTLSHLLTLNSKSRLVNFMGINIFYPLLKVMVKIIIVNMKNGTTNVIFATISLKTRHTNLVQVYVQKQNHPPLSLELCFTIFKLIYKNI